MKKIKKLIAQAILLIIEEIRDTALFDDNDARRVEAVERLVKAVKELE